MQLLFWTAAGVVAYTWIVYPILICLASRLRRPIQPTGWCLPSVSCVIAVHNEAAHLPAKLENLRSIDYPESLVQVVIGSDGSTDGTNAILADASRRMPLTTVVHAERHGKPTMLNTLVPLATGEVLVFMDARQRLAPQALKALVQPFQDPSVGCVSGELVFEDASGGPAGVSLYWNYEKFIRKCESRLGTMLGATGAFYAIRRELFQPIPADALLDDVVVPFRAIERGYRAVLEPQAVVFDRVAADARAEFVRKTRTLAGNFQLLRYFPWLLNPFRGLVAWQFLSHKLLRLFVPYCLAVMFFASWFLRFDPFYILLAAGQAVFYGLAAAGAVSNASMRVLSVPYTFCLMNWAAVVGLYRFLAGSQRVAWQKAEGSR